MGGAYLTSLVYRGWGISSNMIVGIVYVGSSRNRYISKLIIYISRWSITCTVVHVADVDRRLICLSSSRVFVWAAKVYVYRVW